MKKFIVILDVIQNLMETNHIEVSVFRKDFGLGGPTCTFHSFLFDTKIIGLEHMQDVLKAKGYIEVHMNYRGIVHSENHLGRLVLIIKILRTLKDRNY